MTLSEKNQIFLEMAEDCENVAICIEVHAAEKGREIIDLGVSVWDVEKQKYFINLETVNKDAADEEDNGWARISGDFTWEEMTAAGLVRG